MPEDTRGIIIFRFNGQPRQMTELPFPFYPFRPESVRIPLESSFRSFALARVRTERSRTRRSSCAGGGPPVPVAPGYGGGGAHRRRPRALRQRSLPVAASRAAAMPGPKGAMVMESPRFLSDIFPEEHADLSWVPNG
jgi:hypothetical protein